MSLLEASLQRIVDRLGLDRLATDPTLARVALKDLFPDEPLVVSLLTAAVEHGALAALRDDDRHVPLAVLGPRLARELRRDSGISDAGARWAVAAWAAAAGRLPRPLPELPLDGSDPLVADVFSAPAADPAPDRASPDAVVTAVPAAPDDVETLLRSAPTPAAEVVDAVPTGGPSAPASDGSGAVQPGGDSDADLTHVRADLEDRITSDELAGPDGPGDAPTLIAAADPPTVVLPDPEAEEAASVDAPVAQVAPVASVAPEEKVPADEPRAEQPPIEAPAVEQSAAEAPTTDETPVDERPAEPEPEPQPEPQPEPEPVTVSRATTAAPPFPTAPDQAAPPRDRPPGPAARRPRRRRIAAVAAAAAAVLLLGGGLTALTLRPSAALAVAGTGGSATWTVGGHPTTPAAGSALPAGSVVHVRTGPVELRAGGSVLRLATGAKARVEGPTNVTLLAGRAFASASGPALTVDSRAGAATVAQGRALVGCAASTCTVTALDAGTTLRTGSRTTALAALQRAGRDTRAFVLADAVRADPWFARNDALDRTQARTPAGLRGPRVTGTWLLALTRGDLPFPLARTMTLGTDCDPQGCSVTAAIRMSDGIPQSRFVGTARATDADGSRIAVDYGSHSTRCHWVVGTKKGQGVDGEETVTDALRFSGSGSAATVTGERTTRYTPHGGACSTPAFTTAKTAAISGGPATAAQLADAAQTARWSEQQAKLNYVADDGAGCATATTAPRSGLQTDLRCAYPAKGDAPTAVDLAVYDTPAHLVAAYRSATVHRGAADTGDCATGPCEGVAPNGHGRFLLAEDGQGALLITYDPRAANLLLTVRGPSMPALSAWWSAQQRSRTVYQASPIPRVGV